MINDTIVESDIRGQEASSRLFKQAEERRERLRQKQNKVSQLELEGNTKGEEAS